jgi:hypothetical protein
MTHEALRIASVILLVVATGLIAFAYGVHVGVKHQPEPSETDQ